MVTKELNTLLDTTSSDVRKKHLKALKAEESVANEIKKILTTGKSFSTDDKIVDSDIRELIKKAFAEETKEQVPNQKKMVETKENKENKETIEKDPELDDKNFSIDSTSRKETTDLNGRHVKINPEGDVREYITT